MCEYDSRELPVCSCGGDLFIEDNEDYFWGVCSECGRVGEKFEDFEDAYEDIHTWKQ